MLNITGKIVKLGNPLLYEKSVPVLKEELPSLSAEINEMGAILMEFRKQYGYGRAIAAPQIGLLKRIIYSYINNQQIIIINPVLENLSSEMFELWDDCLSFPSLLVKVRRHRHCTLKYTNEKWEERSLELKDDLSELFQHEYDHLEGILAIQRAIDNKSFKWKEDK
jgi:peptide deformylase